MIKALVSFPLVADVVELPTITIADRKLELRFADLDGASWLVRFYGLAYFRWLREVPEEWRDLRDDVAHEAMDSTQLKDVERLMAQYGLKGFRHFVVPFNFGPTWLDVICSGYEVLPG